LTTEEVCLVACLEALNVVSIALCAYPKPIAQSKSSCRITFALEYRRHFALGWNLASLKYGNAYMTEKRKAHGAVVQMVLPAKTTANAEISSVSA